ncbi:5'-nucleotidase C-terminal domain-containing protein [Roseibium sp.]|uniref:5'-nucleotidase C-terminal domain-containing protein n=1 Tax=Roseibium sp. TaxID=1936156 RepID=UPI003B511F83
MLQFNESFYLAQNPDVAAAIEAGVIGSAEEHFNLFGFQEGRDPNAHFDTSFYLEQNPDVAAAGVNPFDHYNLLGESEGRSPNSLFDPVFYAEQYPDIVAAGVSLFEHFINFGASEGRSPNASIASQLESGFDTEAYLAANPDVAAAIENGLFASAYEHWGLFGFKEDRSGAQNTNGDVISIGDGAPGDNPDAAPGDGDGGTGGGGGGGGGTPTPEPFTLELLHFTDQEAGAAAVTDAPNLSAVLNALRDQDLGDDGVADNTLTLSSGDAFIPGIFYDASETVFGAGGIADIQIQNELGVQAIALGNHEFDFGTEDLAGLIDGSAGQDFGLELDDDDNVVSPAVPNFSAEIFDNTDLEGSDFGGTDMPYLSTNLDFSTDADMAPLETEGGQAPQGNSISSSTVIDVNGEQIGVVGAVTPTLGSISSPGTLGISPTWAGSTPTAEELDALAAEIQTEVDALLAANTSMNKVVLLAHMQQLSIEQSLAERLEKVDVIVAGGSNTRLFDENDRPRDGDSDQGSYPEFITNAGGTTTAVVNTDGSYKYVGRLVIDFDQNGNIIADSYDADVSGAYATDSQGVADLDAEGLVDAEIQAIADAIEQQIIATESNVLGYSDVFLNGNRSGVNTAEDTDGVRTQETNLGNLTADANLAAAQAEDDAVVVSIKNGGGIRASIGEQLVPPGGDEAIRTANSAVVDGDGNVIKEEGGISQNDIQTTLAFNNGLTLLTLTKEELVAVLEHGVSALPEVDGRFTQISGVEFSYDPGLASGSRILNAGIFDDDGNLVAELVRDGEISGDAAQEFRVVTLDFLAAPRFDEEGNFTGGGDGYPFPNTNADPTVGEVGDPDTIARVNPVALEDGSDRDGDSTFADNGTEQDALAEYLLDNYGTQDTAFDVEDTGRDEDSRIINVDYNEDDIFDGDVKPASLLISEIMYNPSSSEDDWEWVEVVNPGAEAIDLTGWVIDDINGNAHDEANIAGGVIEAGGSAVLFNSDDISEEEFVAAWGTEINLVPVTNWVDMGLNNGGDTISLWSDFGSYSGDHADHQNVAITVAYDDGGDWPADDGNASIYLTDLTADAGNGTNWDLSRNSQVTPVHTGVTSNNAGGNNGEDIGSPGGNKNNGGGEEPQELAIFEIQGKGHISDFVGEDVRTSGVVTAVDSNGFYMQDPDGDGDIATSDAIFVFTGSTPTVQVGDNVQVEGSVSEFIPGGKDTGNLSITQISNAEIGVTQSVQVVTSTLMGEDGRNPPSEIIDNDAFASFDPNEDGIDFFESLEGMLVTAKDVVAVAGTNQFGEIFGVVDNGKNATGMSERGTLNISPDDFNPEKIQIDYDQDVLDFDFPEVAVGDQLGDVTGVISYSFGNYEILPTVDFAKQVVAGELKPETTTVLNENGDLLTIASYNVLNLDPNDNDGDPNNPRNNADTDVADGRFEALAKQIVQNLDSPDIIALQEIQDSDGSSPSGEISANATLKALIDAIDFEDNGEIDGSTNYAFIDNPFIQDDQSGGQPGGNIRTAFLYNTERVDFIDGSLTGIGVQNEGSPFHDARLPLAASFRFGEEEVTIVNNHLSSKGGGAPILGIEQPFDQRQEDATVNGSLDERQVQAEAVSDWVAGFVQEMVAADREANVVVLGDMNEFEFISPLTTLENSAPEGVEGADLVNLVNTLSDDEIYSFIFQGNSQALDHILVSEHLANAEGVQFDIVHLNSEFAATDGRASDHDPLIVGLDLTSTPDYLMS